MLTLERISTYYGKFRAIAEISLFVEESEMVALVGANGAGKTTVLRSVSGLERPKEGRLLFKDRDITTTNMVERVKMGIVYCPEGRKLFSDMTVLENLEMGAYLRGEDLKKNLKRVIDLFPALEGRRGQRAESLSGGEQQMLAIGRTLMSSPQLILFDEPSVGLAPFLVKKLGGVVERLNKEGRTILLVEQNVSFALGISRRGYIIENGRIVLEGDVSRLKDNEEVRKAYLGG
ncbi:MAG: ABC transporter ATP-binding protein [Pseudomonadota bacterium]